MRFALAAVLTLSARSVVAQTVTGTAVLPDGVTPAAGAIILATDTRGTTAGRALTNQRGDFTIRLPAAGRYSVRLLRIGYRPTIMPAIDVADGATETIRIVASGDVIALATVNVRERETCRVNADTGLMVARVWEEARKAMITTQLSSGAPLFAEWIEYDRVMDSTARLVRQQRITTSRNPTTHAFKSLPAAVLDAKGYVVTESDAVTYYAPDADVLLSDAFVAGHCFHLETPPRGGSADLIGVGFQPTRARADMREIEGTLWLDRKSAELRTLEFLYTNMPDAAEPAHAGGRVEFLRLADGNWLISRWYVRMPRIGARDRTSEAGQRRVVMSVTNTVLRNVLFKGGEVTRVVRGDSLLYRATGPSIVVQVISRDALIVAAGARLTLEGTDYSGTADLAGRIRITPVLAGRYRARVNTPLMDTLGVAPVDGEVEARENGVVRIDSLTLPSSHDVLGGACPRDSIRNGEGMLHGRVTDEHGQSLDHAAVTVTWQTDFAAVSGHLDYRQSTVGALTNKDGYWKACGIPRATALFVRVAADSGTDVRRAKLEEGESLGSIDLVAHRESEAAREAAIAAAPVARPRALVEISVSDIRGAPIPNVALDIDAPGGLKRRLVTGESGRALVPEVVPGRMSVRARRLGFKEGEVIAVVDAGRNTIPIVLSETSGPMLDTMRVLGGRTVSGLARHSEFETRRMLHEATVSITRDEIVKRNPVSLWQLLNGIPSIRVVDMDTMVMAISTRTQVTSILNNGPCPLAILLDGIMLTGDTFHRGYDLRKLPPPEEIYGIEVFAGAASIPAKYGGTGDGKWCGMIALWTR